MTPKPKAEETLKACPCVDDWSGEYNSMADAIKNCPNRRTPAKDEGEKRGTVHLDETICWDEGCESFDPTKASRCKDNAPPDCECQFDVSFKSDSVRPQGDLPPNPTAPADDTVQVIGQANMQADEGGGRQAIEGLQYIAQSPSAEYGGFHPNAIDIAEKALSFIATLQATLAEKEKEAREYKEGGDADAMMVGVLRKRIEALEEQRSVSLNQINTLGAKLKSAEAVVEAARYVIKNTGQEWSHQTRDGFRQAKRALEDYDNQQKQEPEEQHFIEEGLAERCKKV